MADAELASRCGQNLPPRAVVVPDAQGVCSKLVMIGEESGDTCSDDGSDASDAASDSSTELDDAAVDDAVLCDIAAELKRATRTPTLLAICADPLRVGGRSWRGRTPASGRSVGGGKTIPRRWPRASSRVCGSSSGAASPSA